MKAMAALAILVGVLTALATLLALAARWRWEFELLTHFPAQLVLAALLSLVVLLCTRRRLWALLPGCVLALNIAYILPLYFFPAQPEAVGPTYRHVVANVFVNNLQPELFVGYLRSQEPDLVLLMEVDNRWLDVLGELGDMYPHSIAMPRSDAFGMMLLSRYAITSQEMENTELPAIVATVDLDGREIRLAGSHPLPPKSDRYAELRNRQLRLLGEQLAVMPRPVVAAGDFNVTSWSPYFRDLIEQSGLRDSRRGFGIQPTWPDLPLPLRIPIDHALVSTDICVVNRKVGPDVGSDHRPIVLDFRLAKTSK